MTDKEKLEKLLAVLERGRVVEMLKVAITWTPAGTNPGYMTNVAQHLESVIEEVKVPTCPECHGDGYVVGQSVPHDQLPCPTCEGSGKEARLRCGGGYPGGIHEYTENGKTIRCPICGGSGYERTATPTEAKESRP